MFEPMGLALFIIHIRKGAHLGRVCVGTFLFMVSWQPKGKPPIIPRYFETNPYVWFVHFEGAGN